MSRDPGRASHVTQLCCSLTHFSISVSSQLPTWSPSLWPEARIHRVVTGTTPNMRWVLTNYNAFLLTRHVRSSWSVCCESWVTVRCQRFTPRWPGLRCPVCVVNIDRLWRDTLALLLLWACLDLVHSRSCSSFFCRKPHRVSGLNGVDPGSPLFLTPYLEKGAIDEGITPILQTAMLCFFIMFTWATEQTCFLSVCSQEAESGRRASRGQRQELRRLPHRQQEVQQQPLLLVLPCTHGRPTLLLHHRDFPHDRSTVSAEEGRRSQKHVCVGVLWDSKCFRCF